MVNETKIFIIHEGVLKIQTRDDNMNNILTFDLRVMDEISAHNVSSCYGNQVIIKSTNQFQRYSPDTKCGRMNDAKTR